MHARHASRMQHAQQVLVAGAAMAIEGCCSGASVGTLRFRKNCGSHIDASHSRQPLVKGERLVRYEVNAVMVPKRGWCASLKQLCLHECAHTRAAHGTIPKPGPRHGRFAATHRARALCAHKLHSYPEGCAAPDKVQCQCNTRGPLSKLRGVPPHSKINVTSKSPVGDKSVVTLIGTDTTLDHSQKAEKV